ncbi:MAG: hypothetical protein OXS29_15665 [bacterium]|nr:hypothetical protein [bacterium]MDE0288949.1 hypothetical protein [bacterium]MDE0439321.1 hypothetical protein [bacterium]
MRLPDLAGYAFTIGLAVGLLAAVVIVTVGLVRDDRVPEVIYLSPQDMSDLSTAGWVDRSEHGYVRAVLNAQGNPPGWATLEAWCDPDDDYPAVLDFEFNEPAALYEEVGFSIRYRWAFVTDRRVGPVEHRGSPELTYWIFAGLTGADQLVVEVDIEPGPGWASATGEESRWVGEPTWESELIFPYRATYDLGGDDDALHKVADQCQFVTEDWLPSDYGDEPDATGDEQHLIDDPYGGTTGLAGQGPGTVPFDMVFVYGEWHIDVAVGNNYKPGPAPFRLYLVDQAGTRALLVNERVGDGQWELTLNIGHGSEDSDFGLVPGVMRFEVEGEENLRWDITVMPPDHDGS